VKQTQRFHILEIPVANIECTGVIIDELDLSLVVIYRPQSYPVNLFIAALQHLLDHVKKIARNSIILGDFNENILEKHLKIQTHMSQNGYVQVVKEPTTEKGTLIDHVNVRSSRPVAASVIPTYFSFHEAVKILI